MSRAMDADKLALQAVVRHYQVALTPEGYSPRTIETNNSVLRSFLRFAANGREPALAGFNLGRACVRSDHAGRAARSQIDGAPR